MSEQDPLIIPSWLVFALFPILLHSNFLVTFPFAWPQKEQSNETDWPAHLRRLQQEQKHSPKPAMSVPVDKTCVPCRPELPEYIQTDGWTREMPCNQTESLCSFALRHGARRILAAPRGAFS